MAATIPESTKTSLHQRLTARARERWPELAGVQVHFRGRFAYVDGDLDSGQALQLCRLRDRVGLCHLPGQQGRLRGLVAANRSAQRHAAGSLGLRLRALPRRPERLVPAAPLTPHELTNQTT